MPVAPLTIVIPTLNEAVALPTTLSALREAWPGVPVVVADGDSTDGTPEIAAGQGATVLRGLPRSRGQQLRAGASAVQTPWMLFLHADTLIDASAARVADDYMARADPWVAMFRVRFDQAGMLLRFSAWWTRFDSVFTRFGDQGILVPREVYAELGGFPPWPLFEDVEFARTARRTRPIDVLPAMVTTSARRFEKHGPWRQQLRNESLLLRFLAGAEPRHLVRNYPPASRL
jgi:rSAM/selenodomain-associated transferase 2